MGASQPWNLLEESPRRTERLGNPDDLPEEAGTIPAKPGAFSGDAEVLTGEAPAEKIDSRVCNANGSDIVPARDGGPAPFEDLSAERVDFDLPRDGEPGSLKAEVESPD